MNSLYKRIHLPAIVVAGLLGFTSLGAEGFTDVNAEVDRKLEASVKALNDLRMEVAKEKLPLAKEVNELEAEILARGRELDRLERSKVRSAQDVTVLEKKIKTREDQHDYMSSLLNEFVRNFEGRIHVSEIPLYEDATEKAKLALSDTNMSESDQFLSQLDVVDLSIERLENILGGYAFEGEALSEESILEKGTMIAFGPTVYFVSDDAMTTGITQGKANAADPVVLPLDGSLSKGIRTLAEKGKGPLPFDASLGRALKIETSEESYWEHIQKGKVVGYAILLLGSIALIIVIYKLIQVARFKVASSDKVEEVLNRLDQNDKPGALKVAEAIPGASGELLAEGVRHSHLKPGTLEEILYEKVLQPRPKLESYLAFLAITAAAAPLMGLLGTVVGMIKTFNLISLFGTGDAKSLSSGISEALVTTELGLTIAIPVLIAHGLISRLSKRKINALEETAIAFVNGIVVLNHEDGSKQALPKKRRAAVT